MCAKNVGNQHKPKPAVGTLAGVEGCKKFICVPLRYTAAIVGNRKQARGIFAIGDGNGYIYTSIRTVADAFYGIFYNINQHTFHKHAID